MEYEDFIAQKMRTVKPSGFDAKKLHNDLFPFQRFIVERALRAGRYAIFADCGLGKTFMQLEWARQVVEHTGGKVLILAPLAVVGQTIEEAGKWHIPLDGITVTNYEQLDNIESPESFHGVVLDESSILKNFIGETKKKIVDTFAHTPYKLACTATPSPNDPEELGNHAEFLNVATRAEMLAMYFVHDAGDTGEWRIKGHAVKAFWEFVASWAVMLKKPDDIGFPVDGYNLPALHMVEHRIETPHAGGDFLFNDMAVNATGFNSELRRTKDERLRIAADIANGTRDQVIVWIKQNEEAELALSLIPDAVEVRGSDDPEEKKRKLLGFAHGEFRVLVTKTKIASFGLNYQNCHIQVFASLDFSFESLYQAMRRSYRFGQDKEVYIHIISTDTMANVVQAIEEKSRKFDEMQAQMSAAINSYLKGDRMTKADFDTDSVECDDYTIRRGDCVRLIKDVPDESIGLSVFSPPFADLFTYSDHVEDMGNCANDEQFAEQFTFLVRELYRVTKSGRNVAVHCMDLQTQKGRHGHIGIRDFTGAILRIFEDAGFIYHSRVTIWKDPVTAMQRTKALGLLHKQIRKDSTMSRVGIPDTILVFRKDGERNDPVWHYGSYDEAIRAIAGKNLSDEEKALELSRVFEVELWQKYASPIWMDIDQSDTLNFREAREEEDEKHLCPLQLGVIQRLIFLYSNPGDVVLTPFMGVGSEVYQAIKMGRRGIGFELKESYYDMAKKNIALAMKEKSQNELF